MSTLAFGLWFMGAVLATPVLDLPLVGKELCTGLPNPQSTLIAPSQPVRDPAGLGRAFAWFSLGVLVLSVLMVRLWRDRGVARRLMAVRDNETGAGAMGIPLARTKLLAFALSGFIAGYAGVCLAFATERFSTSTFDPTFSILVVSMVVIGGLGSIDGAVLGAIYLVGLPAIFGTTPTIQFLTSGLGLLAFILYLPGGLAELLHRLGDLVTLGVEHLHAAWRRDPAAEPGADAGGSGRRRRRWADGLRRGDRSGPARLEVEGVVVDFGGRPGRGRGRPDGRARIDRRAHRAERLGEDHHARRHLRDWSPRTAGSVRLDGESLVEYLPEERSSLGVVRSFQDCRLFPELSVEDVLLLTQDARRPVGVVSSTLQMPWARRAERAKRAAVDEVIAVVRDRPVPSPPRGPAVHRDPAGGGPGLHRPGPAPPAAAGRAHRRHRPARGRGLRPAAAAAAPAGRHHHRAGRARRAAGLRPVPRW